MSKKDSSFLGTDPIRPLLLRLAWPAVVSSFINMLYNLVDRAFIGKGVGTDALAGLALTTPLMILLTAFGMMAGIGTSAVISIFLGQQKKQDAECALGQLLVLCLLFVVTLQVVALVYLDEILGWFGGNDAIVPYARDYLKIILWGGFFQHISFSMSTQMRAEGNSKKSMVTVLIGAITNIILDPIFIYGFHMGIKGAAYATILSMFISSSYVLRHFILGLGTLRLRLSNLRPNPRMILRIISIGLAPCCTMIAAGTITIIANLCFSQYSGTAEAANQGMACWSIVTSLHLVCLTPLFGLAQGTQPIVGYNFGAKNWDRVRTVYKTALSFGLLVCACIAVVIAFMAPHLVRCFSNSQEMIQVGSRGMRILIISFTLTAFDVLNVHFFQSIGKASVSILLSLQRQLIFFLPSIMLLSKYAGIRNIWWSTTISDTLTFLVSGCISIYILRKYKRMAAEAAVAPPAAP